MILVDDVGRAFPSLNHSPWFGVTLADFVMPFFLFGVGVSIGLVFKVRLLLNPFLRYCLLCCDCLAHCIVLSNILILDSESL
jgi:predicted acyltransferase